MKADAELQADVLDELLEDQTIRPSDLGVAAKDGVVTLFGTVDSLVKRNAAVHATGRVHGVRAIANEISVRLPPDQLRTDTDIAHDAVHALMWDTEVPDKTIRVRVQDRWIWLLGEAESQFQRLAAERAIENIRGVKGVTNLVRLKTQIAPDVLLDQVRTSFAHHAQLAARGIRVSMRGASIVLEGCVQSWGERMAAEHCAWSHRGVTELDNRLVVTPL